MISDVIVVNAHTKTGIGAITDQLLTVHSGGSFAIFISKKKSHGIIVFFSFRFHLFEKEEIPN